MTVDPYIKKRRESYMRFIKENFDIIIKLIINQIGIAIFAFLLYTAAGAIKSEDGGSTLLVKVLISVFSILFYFWLIYNIGWEIGAKDKIRIDGKRMEKKISKGILLGIFANIINFAVIGIAFVLFGAYMLLGAEVLKTVFAVLNLFFRFFSSMYLGAIQGIFNYLPDGDLSFLLETLGFIVFTLIGALVIFISYIMGLGDKRIFPASKNRKYD